VTGNHPGRARAPGELRADLERALALLPGPHRVNLHAIYGEFGGARVERSAIGPEHFRGWIDWAAGLGLGLDFNATFFAHPRVREGLTLTSPDPATRDYWVEHGRRCREIGAAMGRALGTPCLHNLWIPDGSKDRPVDRLGCRRRLRDSLERIHADEHPPEHLLDAVESKLFGIGSESFVAGSYDFYLGYAIHRNMLLCLDTGHFHPTEEVADKISALLDHLPGLLLHLSRGVRWDSDHVVVLDDPTRAVARALVRCRALDRVHLALDFFDGSINRLGAWVTGARALRQALLLALLEPRERLHRCLEQGDGWGRMALLEEQNLLPWGAVWEEYCRRRQAPLGAELLAAVREHGDRVARERGG
jgi:L-rhamnose isomerase